MTALHRVRFDENRGDPEYGYPLDLATSRIDLLRLPRGPREGLKILLVSPDEFSVHAVLRFDKTNNYWIGMPIMETLSYLNKR